MGWIKRRLELLALVWLAFVVLVAALKMSARAVPLADLRDFAEMAFPYYLIAFAPLAGFYLGRAAFRRNRRQPSTRLAFLGRWKPLSYKSARQHPSFGASGLLVTLLIGLLFGVAMRTVEFALSVPALNAHAPDWAFGLYLIAGAEVAVMNFLYMICFVMALRRVPLFPRMLLFVWLVDLASQLALARYYARLGLPDAATEALTTMLTNNANAVLLGVAIWLPYLILSERVNVTFRHRAPLRVG